MPIDLHALRTRGATIEIEVYDMTAAVVYDPTKFSPGFRADYQAKQQQERKELLDSLSNDDDTDNKPDKPLRDIREMYRANARFLENVVKSWEINGINGKPLPVKEAAILDNLPDAIVQHIAREVWQDVASMGKQKVTTESGN